MYIVTVFNTAVLIAISITFTRSFYSYARAAGSYLCLLSYNINQNTQSHSKTLFSSTVTDWKYIMSTWSHGALIVWVGSILYNTLRLSEDLIGIGGPDDLFQCYYIEKHSDLYSSHSWTHLMMYNRITKTDFWPDSLWRFWRKTILDRVECHFFFLPFSFVFCRNSILSVLLLIHAIKTKNHNHSINFSQESGKW